MYNFLITFLVYLFSMVILNLIVSYFVIIITKNNLSFLEKDQAYIKEIDGNNAKVYYPRLNIEKNMTVPSNFKKFQIIPIIVKQTIFNSKIKSDIFLKK